MTDLTEEKADCLGVCASALCLVHCLVMPFIFPALPLFALEEENVHILLAVLVLAAALPAFYKGYRRHGHSNTFLGGLIGGSIVVAAIFLPHDLIPPTRITLQGAVTSLGGFLLIAAHLKNLSLCTTCRFRLN